MTPTDRKIQIMNRTYMSTVQKLTEEIVNYKKAATELWHILDAIDTQSDACRGDNEQYAKRVDRLVRKRHAIMSTDGYSLFSPDGDVVEYHNGSDSI